MLSKGPLLALLSSALFGVSPVFAKLLIGDMSPALLAGLLYFGSGVALLGFVLITRTPVLANLRRLSLSHRWKLVGAIVAGGVLAPLCLAYGIQKGSAFEVSLLLNLESVTTTVIAWLIFREHVGRAVWSGKVLLVVGGIIISVSPASQLMISAAGLLVLGACFFWGIDNNLTRDIDELPSTVLAAVKGLAAGVFNIGLAFFLEGAAAPVSAGQLSGAMLLGAMSYGVSLVLFIGALRIIGASRTSTYFAVGPFFGMLFAVLLLGDRPEVYQWTAALFMAAGLWVLYKEHHEHAHSHELLTHGHQHSHDEHHRHSHPGTALGEPHDHVHTHEDLKHAHAHFPDIHHRHGH
ncbi:MAG: EamA family transporter [Oligoflexia bacterium]|nr:EamA family transporter [Oligoflexia bacterium]